MRAASTVLTLSFAAGLMTAGTAQALGFGRVVNATQLGQRLNFGALVRLDADESLDRDCVFAEVSAGDNLLQPGQVRVTLENGSDRAERTVRVSTSTVIDEPVVSVNLTLGCNARSSRRFVVFIDPPGIQLAPAAASADSALLMPQRDDSQLAPLVALLAPEPPRRPAVRRQDASADPAGDRHRQRSVESAAAAPRSRPLTAASASVAGTQLLAGHPRKPASAPRRTAVVDRPPASARLQLDAPARPLSSTAAASAGQATAAALPASGSAAPLLARSLITHAAGSAPAAAAGSAPAVVAPADAAALALAEQQSLLQRERERVQLLEQGLARLQADAADTRKTVAALQASLRQAEAGHDPNRWVYALGMLSAVLTAVLAAGVWRRRQPKPAAPWWKVGVAASLFGRQSLVAESVSATLDTPSSAAALSESPSLPASGEDRFVAGVDPSLPSAADPRFPSRFVGPAGVVATTEPARVEPLPTDSPSVEELIDLEQQVEFFVVLGQDDAAIELLTHHLQADGATSPLPYLKLLEIHRRRGDRVGYEEIRARFNRDFNAYAPGWEADLQQGRALENYPEVVDRLQRDWDSPARAMDLLEASLFHRGPGQIAFDLPAYRELLSLYSIARDQAQQVGAAPAAGPRVDDVDLLLPLGNASSGMAPIAWLKATAQPAARPPADETRRVTSVALDVDVSLPAEPEERSPRPVLARPLAAPMTASRAPLAMPRKASLAVPDECLETVPSALRRPDGHPDESVFVDLVLEPIEVSVR